MWTVIIPKKVQKQVDKLERTRRDIWATFRMLVRDLGERGPEVPDWRNFGKLTTGKKEPDMYHCHLNKGKPTYVVVWRVENKTVEMMEVRYVGTHEGADYKRIR